MIRILLGGTTYLAYTDLSFAQEFLLNQFVLIPQIPLRTDALATLGNYDNTAPASAYSRAQLGTSVDYLSDETVSGSWRRTKVQGASEYAAWRRIPIELVKDATEPSFVAVSMGAKSGVRVGPFRIRLLIGAAAGSQFQPPPQPVVWGTGARAGMKTRLDRWAVGPGAGMSLQPVYPATGIRLQMGGEAGMLVALEQGVSETCASGSGTPPAGGGAIENFVY